MTALTGCSTNPTKQEIGTATGAVIGSAAGAVLTGGSTLWVQSAVPRSAA